MGRSYIINPPLYTNKDTISSPANTVTVSSRGPSTCYIDTQTTSYHVHDLALKVSQFASVVNVALKLPKISRTT